MDDIDMQILKKLSKNPQMPFSRVGDEIGISPITVQRRYRKMKDEDILLQSSIALDLSKLGYQGKAYVMITTGRGNNKEGQINALMRMKDVFLVTEVTGDYDLLAIAAVRDFRNTVELVNKVKRLPNVCQVEVAFTMETEFPVGKDIKMILDN